MEFRLNILFSFFIHALLAAVAFAIALGDGAFRIPETHITVALLEGFSEIGNTIRETGSRNENNAAPLRKPFDHPAASETPLEPHSAHQGKSNEPTPTVPQEEASARTGTVSETGTAEIGNNAEGVRLSVVAGNPSGNVVSSLGHGTTGDGITGQGIGRMSSGSSSSPDIYRVIRAAIEKSLIYPPIAKKRGIEGTTIAAFSINGRGQPENIRIILSSGSQILDAAARETIVKAAPLPPVNRSFEIPVTFRLKKGN